jgi:hypothetical protein
MGVHAIRKFALGGLVLMNTPGGGSGGVRKAISTSPAAEW